MFFFDICVAKTWAKTCSNTCRDSRRLLYNCYKAWGRPIWLLCNQVFLSLDFIDCFCFVFVFHCRVFCFVLFSFSLAFIHAQDGPGYPHSTEWGVATIRRGPQDVPTQSSLPWPWPRESVELGPRESVEPLGPRKSVELETLSSEVIIGCQPQLTRRSHGINQAPGLFYRNQSGVRPVLPCYCCCVAAGIRATLLIFSQPSPGRRGIISISFDLSRFFFFFHFCSQFVNGGPY